METGYIEWPYDNNPAILIKWIDSWWKMNPPGQNRDLAPISASTWGEFVELWFDHYRHRDKITLEISLKLGRAEFQQQISRYVTKQAKGLICGESRKR